MENKDREVLTFIIVGSIAVIIQYGFYYILLGLLNHSLSYIFAYLISFIANYILTTKYTFKVNRTTKNGIGFVISHVLNFILQLCLLNIFIFWSVPKELAPIPVYAISVPTNFMLVRFVMKR